LGVGVDASSDGSSRSPKKEIRSFLMQGRALQERADRGERNRRARPLAKKDRVVGATRGYPEPMLDRVRRSEPVGDPLAKRSLLRRSHW